jgi:peptidoglycan/LPS O-acetylase OafA/YrhL
MDNVFTRNSLDLVRLLAASDVMIGHYLGHVGQQHYWLGTFLLLFPGVPVFFFISGFVISGAWLRQPEASDYALARITRIFPALIVPLLVGLGGLFLFYDRDLLADHAAELGLWSLSQLTVPGWNPGFLRNYGIGVVNGSLWTIPIEVSFYVMAPLMLITSKRLGNTAIVLGAAMLLSLIINVWAHHGLPQEGPGSVGLYKIMTASPLAAITWFWMFATGMLAQHWFVQLRDSLVRRVWWIVALWALVTIFSLNVEIPGLLRPWPNHVGLLNLTAAAAAILALAYRFPDGARRLLRGNDISYGIYILHLPVLNAFLAAGWLGDGCIVAATMATTGFALLSWFLIERPLMREVRARRMATLLPASMVIP